jgi:hypothetical protein
MTGKNRQGITMKSWSLGFRWNGLRSACEHAAVVREFRGESLADGIRHVGG